jgi:hypothetical protein
MGFILGEAAAAIHLGFEIQPGQQNRPGVFFV